MMESTNSTRSDAANLAPPAAFVMGYGRSDSRSDLYRRLNVTDMQQLVYKLEDLLEQSRCILYSMKRTLDADERERQRKRLRVDDEDSTDCWMRSCDSNLWRQYADNK